MISFPNTALEPPNHSVLFPPAAVSSRAKPKTYATTNRPRVQRTSPTQNPRASTALTKASPTDRTMGDPIPAPRALEEQTTAVADPKANTNPGERRWQTKHQSSTEL